MTSYNRPGRTDSEERLVEAARKLFFLHGVRRVTVDEICSQAGVSKMTFYRRFADKTAVALRVLEEISGRMRREFGEIELMDIPFEVKLRSILELQLEHARAFGRELLAETLKGADPALERYMDDQRLASLQSLRDLFASAQRRGEMRKDVRIELVIHMLDAAREALADEGLRSLYPDEASLAQEAFDLFYYGALRRPA